MHVINLIAEPILQLCAESGTRYFEVGMRLASGMLERNHVIPAKAGIQVSINLLCWGYVWIPAFAGLTA